MVLDNLNLVYSTWHKFRHTPLMKSWEEDFYSEGYFALCRAALDFDPSLGFEFSTLACTYIKNKFLHFIRWLNGNVALDDSGDAPKYKENDDTGEITVFEALESNLTKWGTIDQMLDLKEYLSRLSERKRKIFTLWAEGWDWSSIATFFHASYTEVQSTLIRIKKELRQMEEDKRKGRAPAGENIQFFGKHCIDTKGRYIPVYRYERWKRAEEKKKAKKCGKNIKNS